MPNKLWKNIRQEVEGRQASSVDLLNRKYFVWMEEPSKFPFSKRFKELRAEARRDGKRPMLVFHKKGRAETIVVMDLNDFEVEENGEQHVGR